ncbi:MAG: DUF6797 domain-containing protein [Akkermansiaceae bacterium]
MKNIILIGLLLHAALHAEISEPSAPEGFGTTGFIEKRTPFIRSAIVFKYKGREHTVRRGVLIPLRHKNLWACFDPDTLRWVAVWRAPKGQSPITYDSMAAVSFPDKKAKATQPPKMQGKLILAFPGIPPGEIAKDVRQQKLLFGESAVGPLPTDEGRWLGIRIQEETPIIRYRLGSSIINQAVTADLEHCFIVKSQLAGARKSGVTRYSVDSAIGVKSIVEPFVSDKPATPVFPKEYDARNNEATISGSFSVRNIELPNSPRVIRATDIAFSDNGAAYLTTLDGDIWRVEGISSPKSTWTRIAAGLFEPLAMEVTHDGKIYTLGRDQITQLIDHNHDGHIDEYRCASDAFLQTLHTRDFATSLAVADDGSFIIAKGGIVSMNSKKSQEMSDHRGAVVRISPDGDKAKVLADGLRIPYVGLRKDGVVFASDQQGHYVPSTPIFYIPARADRYTFGFAQTNHRKTKKLDEPLLYYPYQHNRSAAAFHELDSSKAFPDFSPAFLQVSWDGRLFAVATPQKGRSFSYRWPLQLDFPSLNAATHPVTGELYAVGIGISGYKPTTPKLAGLAAVSQAHPMPVPANLVIKNNQVIIKWSRPLGKDETVTPMMPALRLYNVKRSRKYGSGHYLADGKAGEHRMQPTSATLSSDRRTQTLTFPALFSADILDLKLQVSHGAVSSAIHIYTRPHDLPEANSRDLALLIDDKPVSLKPGNITKGKAVFKTYACNGCHSLADEKLTGPPLLGLSTRLSPVQIRESILQPAKVIAKGYPAAMPSFDGVMTPQQLEDLLAYLATLKN